MSSVKESVSWTQGSLARFPVHLLSPACALRGKVKGVLLHQEGKMSIRYGYSFRSNVISSTYGLEREASAVGQGLEWWDITQRRI